MKTKKLDILNVYTPPVKNYRTIKYKKYYRLYSIVKKISFAHTDKRIETRKVYQLLFTIESSSLDSLSYTVVVKLFANRKAERKLLK